MKLPEYKRDVYHLKWMIKKQLELEKMFKYNKQKDTSMKIFYLKNKGYVDKLTLFKEFLGKDFKLNLYLKLPFNNLRRLKSLQKLIDYVITHYPNEERFK